MSSKWNKAKAVLLGLKNGWEKLTQPSVALNETAFPLEVELNEIIGVKFGYTGMIEENAKKIPQVQR